MLISSQFMMDHKYLLVSYSW